MLSMLHLILTILKYCSLLTMLRLASTAFGWEFGVSRQYLRLLELLFHLGKRRIDKVDSDQRLSEESLHSNHRSSGSPLAEIREEPSPSSPPSPPPVPVPAHVPREPTINGAANHKSRRISTPDGPPVFLLDQGDDDDDYYNDNHGGGGGDGDDVRGDENDPTFKRHQFQLIDPCKLVLCGLSAIVDDQVTKRFTPEELQTWNLLTRTTKAHKKYQLMSPSLGLYWLLGFLVRYTILMPLRIMFTLAGFGWLLCTMTLVGCLPQRLRHKPYRLMSLMSFRMLSCGITSRLEFHNRQYRAKNGDICVANHTSPLDVVMLACDNCYALVGQRHGGLLGILESALSRATTHVWFDRSEIKDRQLVTQRLKEHAANKTNLPVLIFPEGTCINNSAVMMFRKGSFETTDTVCPVAIKYDARFGDPFWNSSKQSYFQYLLLMMSSWAIKCDVWYLPPMDRLSGESSAEFANRVKAEIAKQGGLLDLPWDGQLKRTNAKEIWKHQQQEDYAKRLKLE